MSISIRSIGWFGALAVIAAAKPGEGQIITGIDEGAPAQVKAFTMAAEELSSFLAYDTTFQGGVRVAAGDINGDRTSDIITGAGTVGAGHVKVFDGTSGAELRSFFAYPGFTGGVYVAAGDVDNDQRDDIVTGAGAGGGPHVKVFSGATGSESRSFFAYPESFSGGVRVATGDVNGDGFDDIITGAGAGGGGHVRVFSGASGSELRSFFAYGGFSGGVYVASGDVNNDGLDDIVTGVDAGGGPHVKVFDGVSGAELRSFFAYDQGFTGGVRVATGDVNGDGFADIVTGAGAGGGGHVKIFDGSTGGLLKEWFAFGRGYTGGVFVGAASRIPEPTSGALLAAAIASAAMVRRLRWAA